MLWDAGQFSLSATGAGGAVAAVGEGGVSPLVSFLHGLCVLCRGLMDRGGDTLSLPPVPFVPITHRDLVARSLMWFVLGGWRNESYSVAFSEEECVI